MHQVYFRLLGFDNPRVVLYIANRSPKTQVVLLLRALCMLRLYRESIADGMVPQGSLPQLQQQQLVAAAYLNYFAVHYSVAGPDDLYVYDLVGGEYTRMLDAAWDPSDDNSSISQGASSPQLTPALLMQEALEWLQTLLSRLLAAQPPANSSGERGGAGTSSSSSNATVTPAVAPRPPQRTSRHAARRRGTQSSSGGGGEATSGSSTALDAPEVIADLELLLSTVVGAAGAYAVPVKAEPEHNHSTTALISTAAAVWGPCVLQLVPQLEAYVRSAGAATASVPRPQALVASALGSQPS